MAARRKQKSSIQSVEVLNSQDDQGNWISESYSISDWVLMKPSTRGRFKVNKKQVDDRSKHWKGRIKSFRRHPQKPSVIEVLVQHVYMHKEIAISHDQNIGQKPNSK